MPFIKNTTEKQTRSPPRKYPSCDWSLVYLCRIKNAVERVVARQIASTFSQWCMRSWVHLKSLCLWAYIYLLLTEFEGRTVSYWPSFSARIYVPRAKRVGPKFPFKRNGRWWLARVKSASNKNWTLSRQKFKIFVQYPWFLIIRTFSKRSFKFTCVITNSGVQTSSSSLRSSASHYCSLAYVCSRAWKFLAPQSFSH